MMILMGCSNLVLMGIYSDGPKPSLPLKICDYVRADIWQWVVCCVCGQYFVAVGDQSTAGQTEIWWTSRCLQYKPHLHTLMISHNWSLLSPLVLYRKTAQIIVILYVTEYRAKGNGVPSLKSLLVVEERMRSSHRCRNWGDSPPIICLRETW